jgi:hypothetical protein
VSSSVRTGRPFTAQLAGLFSFVILLSHPSFFSILTCSVSTAGKIRRYARFRAAIPPCRGSTMKTMTCVLAVLAAISTAAVAKDLTAPTPTVKGQVMSDAEMDKVTAGVAVQTGAGIYTAQGPSGGHANNGLTGIILNTGAANPPGGTPGLGRCTAGRALCD